MMSPPRKEYERWKRHAPRGMDRLYLPVMLILTCLYVGFMSYALLTAHGTIGG